MSVSFEMLFDGDAMAVLSQKKDWAETFTGMEQANKYRLVTSKKEVRLEVVEQSPNWFSAILRILLGGQRGYTIDGIVSDGSKVFRLKKKPAFIETGISVFDGQEKLLGKVAARPYPARHAFDLFDPGEKKIGSLVRGDLVYGPFTISDADDVPIAQFEKRSANSIATLFWSDADDYEIEVKDICGQEQHWLPFVFGCILLVDLHYFEDSGGSYG